MGQGNIEIKHIITPYYGPKASTLSICRVVGKENDLIMLRFVGRLRVSVSKGSKHITMLFYHFQCRCINSIACFQNSAGSKVRQGKARPAGKQARLSRRRVWQTSNA